MLQGSSATCTRKESLPLPSALGDGWGDRATRGVLVEEVLALIFVLMVGDGGSIRFGTRD